MLFRSKKVQLAQAKRNRQSLLDVGVGGGGGGGGGGRGGRSGGTTSYRYVGPGEAAEALKTGYAPNYDQYGKPKTVYYTPDPPLTSASQAQQTYNLPNTPTHRLNLDTSRVTNTYGGNGQGINGIEMMTNNKIPVKSIQELDE